MAKATIASRVLKNKDTGLEMYVPSFSQSKGMLTSTVIYQVVAVSNLACFKTPKHKESDVVQFSLEKKMSEFEDLRNSLVELYPHTALPPMHKKTLMLNDAVLKERKNCLDYLMRAISSTPKIATSVPVLIFLGVDSIRAKKFSLGEPSDSTKRESQDKQDISSPSIDEETESQDDILFGSGAESDNEDLFGDPTDRDDADGLFGGDNKSRAGQFQVFEGQDLKGDLTDQDEKDFSYVPGGIITKKEVVRPQTDDDLEDNSQLLEIEDDLDKLMQLRPVAKQKVDKKESSKSPNFSSVGQPENTKSSSSSSQSIKPKPSIASKPKIAAKPSVADRPNALSSSSGKPEIPSKPKKPITAEKPSVSLIRENSESTDLITDQNDSGVGLEKVDNNLEKVDNLDQDDIMKYLQDNMQSGVEEEVDLFS